MCGINGFTFEDKDLIVKMNDANKHRGPDASNFWLSEGVSLGQNRLSIIDVSNASSQPMQSKDGRYEIVYNGELYNFQDIKKELSEVNFTSTGDTEVVIEAYAKWGKDCLQKFNGMFALAIWDKQEQSLFLARDHAGIKPLYYSVKDGDLIFSSEIKSILTWSKVTRKLSVSSLNHYLRLLFVPEPFTMFQDVFKLPQGSYGYFKNGKLDIQTYFVNNPNLTKAGTSEIIENINTKVSEAVERQLVSDRPVGVYLSGGIDSSVILDCMSRKHKNIKTFSVGFTLSGGEDAGKYNKDLDLARETAKRYNTDHHEISISSKDVMESLEKVIYHMDEPISNATACALFALSKETKKYVTVVLCGDGGDELFGGYDRYRLSYIASMYQILPLPVTNLLAKVNARFAKISKRDRIDRYTQFLFQKTDMFEKVIKPQYFDDKVTRDYLSKYLVGRNFEEAIMETDRKVWLVDFALMLSDTMSMAHGLEARVPFLDKEVVSYASSIPAHKKLSFFTNKKLLKSAFKNTLPEYLFKQPKRGFFTPAAKWLRHPEFLAMTRNILSAEYAPGTSGIFDWVEINKMLDDHVSKKKYNLNTIWALITFQIWSKLYDVQE
jgi:asparagine synthase (glutamine-hydrolysing)